jgi:hypothetical protein
MKPLTIVAVMPKWEPLGCRAAAAEAQTQSRLHAGVAELVDALDSRVVWLPGGGWSRHYDNSFDFRCFVD